MRSEIQLKALGLRLNGYVRIAPYIQIIKHIAEQMKYLKIM